MSDTFDHLFDEMVKWRTRCEEMAKNRDEWREAALHPSKVAEHNANDSWPPERLEWEVE